MRNIRTYADIKAARAAGELTSAEEQLIECCKEGWFCELGDGTLPTASSDDRTIGADLLRYLILGGCKKYQVHNSGMRLCGAYVRHSLDLHYAKTSGATMLVNCFFEEKIEAHRCRFDSLILQGSTLQNGLNAHAAEFKGNVVLREGFRSLGFVNLMGAEIGGQLNCSNGFFSSDGQIAFSAQSASIAGSLFMNGDFFATEIVDLNNAVIGGTLDFTNSSFFGDGIRALHLQSTKANSLFWRGVHECRGLLDLNGAYFSTVVSDIESWDKTQEFLLDNFTYDHLVTNAHASELISWVQSGSTMDGKFSPQPYTQLAKVLRNMGHDHGARQVLLAKEERLAQAEKQRSLDRIAALKAEHAKPAFRDQSQQAQQNSQVELTKLREEQFFATLWSGTLRRLVGYGYKPRLIFYWTGGIILAMAVLSSLTYRLGGMVPNAPVVLLSDEWGRAVIELNPAEAWLATPAGQHYETFFALAYAADVFIPLVPLGQEVAWAPTTATWLGTVLWVLNWLVKLAGWFITALGAAAIAGVIRRE